MGPYMPTLTSPFPISRKKTKRYTKKEFVGMHAEDGDD
jgi:hypothetical protein